MSKHTPGPWEVVYDESGKKPLTIRSTGMVQRAILKFRALSWLAGSNPAADAALMAAAPDLLTALQSIRDNTYIDADGPELRAQNESNYRRAVGAIAKATGAEA